MFPAIAIIALMAALAGTNETGTVPSEVLAPVYGGAIYIGDNLECTGERESMWRYATDKSLSVCSEGQWRSMASQPEAR